ncbi:MAG: ATP-binding cassette domain-containing protein [Bacteroidota bacterium]
MTSLSLNKVSKRYGRQWIIREMTEELNSGETIGISGRNGSGKSTLLRLLAGQLTPSRGKLTLTHNDKPVRTDEWYRLVSWTGPYLEVAEELTIEELFAFHFGLKPLREGIDLKDLPARIELAHARKRKLTDCSSGMRQRVLLATALYAATPILLLDEPTLTLDEEAIGWFRDELGTCGRARIVCIASNDANDLRDVDRIIRTGTA